MKAPLADILGPVMMRDAAVVMTTDGPSEPGHVQSAWVGLGLTVGRRNCARRR